MSASRFSTEVLEIVVPGVVGPEGLVARQASIDRLSPGHVLLEMEASGVSFAEQQMRRGTYFNQPAFPFVPGYDLVGTVRDVGDGVDPRLIGARYAAVTKIGAWATFVEVDGRELLPVPEGVDPVHAEALTVNGITAWQMLHQVAAVPAGATIVVLGANGGVGSTLVQLAQLAGIRVIGSASARHHAYLRGLGTEVVDYLDGEMYERIRQLAPDGVDAVFDHVGGDNIRLSWGLLRRGGTLVSYGTAATKNDQKGSRLPVLKLFARLLLWAVLPNGKTTHFYNFWAGRRRTDVFRAAKRRAFADVMDILVSGQLIPTIAARFPLSEAGAALRLAESSTVSGKVILLPPS